MADREKVIKGLENCLHYKGHCIDCPYNSQNCQNDVLNDAISMLKEKKQKVRPTHKCVDGYSYITDPYMVYCPYCGKPIIGRKNIR